MESQLGVSANGDISDNHVERMFFDIHNCTEDDGAITLYNFNLYMSELYGTTSRVSDMSSVDELTTLAVRTFSHVLVYEMDDPVGNVLFGVRFNHWPEDFYTAHSKLANAIALAIVQDMRYTISEQLNKGHHTAH